MGTLEKIKKLVGQGTVVLIAGRLAIMRNWTEEIQKESCGRFADRAGRRNLWAILIIFCSQP